MGQTFIISLRVELQHNARLKLVHSMKKIVLKHCV